MRERGYKAEPYHAGLEAEARHRVQDSFLKDEIAIVCATVAFGMGIDKSNVRWVVHWNLPKNLEGFYQEIGRAGRDGLPADTLLFYSYADIAQQLAFIKQVNPNRQHLLEAKLERIKQYAEAKTCRRRILLNYFGETLDKDCGNCDCCENPPETFDGRIIAQKFLSAMYRTEGKATLRQCALILRGSHAQEITEPGWHNLKTFGVGKELGFSEWMEYGAQLINSGYGAIAYDQGMAVRPTALSDLILKANNPVPLVKFVEFGSKKSATSHPKEISAAERDQDLLDQLKALRKNLAAQRKLPAYIIFSDKTLNDMAAKLPKTPQEFLQVHGVGEAKAQSFGPIFLQVIQDWRILKGRF